jgi:hypothetical protein
MRIDVLGLTLAETALVLLFAIFSALLASKAEENRALKRATGQQEQIAALQRDLNSERQSNSDLSRRMAALLPKLRSSAFPSCAETGKAQGWLFTATVRGRDAYEIDGDRLTLADLIKKYSEPLREASTAECRQRIRLYVSNEISGEEYEYAMRRVSQYFYVGYMGPR